jgi:hypothetical protein
VETGTSASLDPLAAMKMKTLTAIAFILTVSACSNYSDVNKEPVRKIGIPENAFWVGGVDGGNWYLAGDVNGRRSDGVISIYNDQDGSLIVSKRFTLMCQDKSLVPFEDLQKHINGFDGKRIFLTSFDGKKPCFLQ